MHFFAYAFGLSLAPVLVGLILALFALRIVFKTKLIRQLKIFSYVISLFVSAICIVELAITLSSAHVVIGVAIGFAVTFLLGVKFRKTNNEKQIETEKNDET